MASIYRIYKTTVQRLPLHLSSINSNAAFLFFQESEREVTAWIGSDCNTEDSDLAKEIALFVIQKDYGKSYVKEIPIVTEGSEVVNYLQVILDILSTTINVYSKRS
jgi:hypothetical protein